jgi:hypothetical protein
MKIYYHTPERCALLQAEALDWLGTPFSENCAVKGRDGGVDCVHFLAAVHTAAGACAAVDLPTLPVEQVRAWHQHNTRSLILDWLGQPAIRGRVRRLDVGEPLLSGDMPVLKVGLTGHHLALVCGPELLHVAIPAGVVSASMRDRELLAAMLCAYRIFEAPVVSPVEP